LDEEFKGKFSRHIEIEVGKREYAREVVGRLEDELRFLRNQKQQLDDGLEKTLHSLNALESLRGVGMLRRLNNLLDRLMRR
jgi:hypothetical protein